MVDNVEELDAATQKLISSAVNDANEWKDSLEHAQIVKNHTYFTGGLGIELSLRGGYAPGELGSITDVESRQLSPKGTTASESIWRAPAQKANEPWVDFATRRLEYMNFVDIVATERGSVLYRTAPRREIAGPLSDEFETVWEDPANDTLGKFVSFHINSYLGGTVAVIPWWDETRDRLIYKGYPRKNFDIRWNIITGEIEALTIFYDVRDPDTGRRMTEFNVWTRDFACMADEQGQVKTGSIKPHPCGVVPVVLFKEPTHDLLSPYGTVGASDVVNSNEQLNIQLSDLARISAYQSFSLLVTTNMDGEKTIGPGSELNARNVNADQPADAKYIHPDAKIRELHEIVRHRIEMIISQGRIPKAVVMDTSSAKSGVHLAISWFPMLRAFQEAKVAYIDNERRLAEMTAVVLTRWAGFTQDRTSELDSRRVAPVPDIDFAIDFDDSNVIPTDDETRRARDEFDLQIGVKTPIDIMLRENPDLSEEEAESEYMKKQEQAKRIGFLPAGVGGKFKGPGLQGQLDIVTGGE